MEDKMESKPLINIDYKQFKPKSLGQRCPVCNGFGTLNYGKKQCQACEGRGYILIPIEEDKT